MVCQELLLEEQPYLYLMWLLSGIVLIICESLKCTSVSCNWVLGLKVYFNGPLNFHLAILFLTLICVFICRFSKADGSV